MLLLLALCFEWDWGRHLSLSVSSFLPFDSSNSFDRSFSYAANDWTESLMPKLQEVFQKKTRKGQVWLKELLPSS